ncbi:putative transmembrane protein [Rhodopirellula islandica]|uniref:Transmembrane protein n=1 Tax=Rhodopirellula islandica TaxID=595434 RepID=A0A0J1B8H1_RHOIS|nr:putative transmembrane protein [Rhodopirellula islandica]
MKENDDGTNTRFAIFMNDKSKPHSKPDPFQPPHTIPDEGERKSESRSLAHAFFIGCRNGFFWSLLVAPPVAWFVAPVIPRHRTPDSEGNLPSLLEEFGWFGMIERAAPGLVSISIIWTLSAGLSSLIDRARQQQSQASNQNPTKE